jgi:hypothetical protein
MAVMKLTKMFDPKNWLSPNLRLSIKANINAANPNIAAPIQKTTPSSIKTETNLELILRKVFFSDILNLPKHQAILN